MKNSPFALDLENLKRVESLCLIKETTAFERFFLSKVSDTLPLRMVFWVKARWEAPSNKRTVSSFLIKEILVG